MAKYHKVQKNGLRMAYPRTIPTAADEIPTGWVLVHNRVRAVRPDQRQGRNGFRFFLIQEVAAFANQNMQPCRCGWAPHLSSHYQSAPSTEEGDE